MKITPGQERTVLDSPRETVLSTSASEDVRTVAEHVMMPLDVVTFGEAMAMFVAQEPGDLSQVTEFTRRIAGADLNVAIGLARLGFRVGWVSRVGKDSFGRMIMDLLDREKIDRQRVTVDADFPTGFQLKSRSAGGGDPIVEYFRRGSAASHLSFADFDPAYFLPARHLHVTGVAPALSRTSFELAQHAIHEMKSAGKTISFDPNLRPVLWPSKEKMIEQMNALAELSDWVLPGLAEGEILTGRSDVSDIARFYLEKGASLVAIKLGEKGSFLKTREKTLFVPAVPVANVVDTVGAGDGFAVGLISGMLEGLDPQQAVARGNEIAALVIQQIGDSEGLPNREQMKPDSCSTSMLG